MLKIRNLESGYGKLRVLKGISLHVSPGEIVIIIGANGAGKTTLLKTISGILKAREDDSCSVPCHSGTILPWEHIYSLERATAAR
jgi:ABC-type branched-subunit amino acid transport system ATPase component